MELNRLMFREYDIRGIWNEDITEEISYHIGRAYATKLLSFGKNKMIVGYDNRLSSPIIEENLVKGLTEGGVNVVRLGLVTTPMYYYAWDKLNIHAGIMITASHNPKEYNGYKVYDNNGCQLSTDNSMEVTKLIDDNNILPPYNEHIVENKGTNSIANHDVDDCFINDCKKVCLNPQEEKKIKVVLLEPGKLARTAEIDASLAGMQKVVGGLIEPFYPFEEQVCIVCNEESKINGMRPNRSVKNDDGVMVDFIFGPAFICDCRGENLDSLSDEQIDRYGKMFRYPEHLARVNDTLLGIPYRPQPERER